MRVGCCFVIQEQIPKMRLLKIKGSRTCEARMLDVFFRSVLKSSIRKEDVGVAKMTKLYILKSIDRKERHRS
jgi:hypothetical protein